MAPLALKFALLIGWRDFLSIWSPSTWLFGWCVRIATGAAVWILLGRLLQSPSTETYLLIGQIFTIAASAACWVVPASAWDRLEGTFEPISLVPSSYLGVLVARTAVWCVNGVASGLLAGTLLLLAFQPSLPIAALPGLAGALLVSCCSTFAFGLCHGLLVAKWPSLRNLLLGLITTELTLFSGAVVPTDYWPAWIQLLSSLLPVTHALAGARAAWDGRSGLIDAVLLEVVIAVLWCVLGAVLARLVLLTKRKAS
jgi:ABC-2 type transport system permease protein